MLDALINALLAVVIGWLFIAVWMLACFAILWPRHLGSARKAWWDWMQENTPFGAAFWKGKAH